MTNFMMPLDWFSVRQHWLNCSWKSKQLANVPCTLNYLSHDQGCWKPNPVLGCAICCLKYNHYLPENPSAVWHQAMLIRIKQNKMLSSYDSLRPATSNQKPTKWDSHRNISCKKGKLFIFSTKLNSKQKTQCSWSNVTTDIIFRGWPRIWWSFRRFLSQWLVLGHTQRNLSSTNVI